MAHDCTVARKQVQWTVQMMASDCVRVVVSPLVYINRPKALVASEAVT